MGGWTHLRAVLPGVARRSMRPGEYWGVPPPKERCTVAVWPFTAWKSLTPMKICSRAGLGLSVATVNGWSASGCDKTLFIVPAVEKFEVQKNSKFPVGTRKIPA